MTASPAVREIKLKKYDEREKERCFSTIDNSDWQREMVIEI